MGIKDVIKKSVLDNFQNVDISMETALLFLLAACCMGLYIYVIYRVYTAHSFYSSSFNLSLVLMCVLTAAIIITIQSSIVVSLGMVGALSIVRFRTAVKEPMDLAFLYWAISMGIIIGAGMVGLSIVATAVITLLFAVIYLIPDKKHSWLLNVSLADGNKTSELYDIIRNYDKRYHLHSVTLNGPGADILLEINTKKSEEMLKQVNGQENVIAASLISHRGDAVY